LRLKDKDLLQIDATVIAGVLVLSTVGALKLNITVIAWLASTVIWFSFSAFLSVIAKPDASLVQIKDDISDAYSKEKISELHYSLLEKKLSNYEKDKI